MAGAIKHERKSQRTVLLLADRRSSAIRRHLERAGYIVNESFTTDHAVAICVSNPIDAVVLHQDCFIETDGWSVAQSVKAVKPNLCVLLVSRSKQLSKTMPKGVDAMVSAYQSDALVTALEEMLGNGARRPRRASERQM